MHIQPHRFGGRTPSGSQLLVGLYLCSAVVALCGCGGEVPVASNASSSGFADRSYIRERSLDYLRFATQTLQPGNVLNVVAHMERSRIDPGYSAPAAAVPADAWDGIYAKLAALEDTRDFDALYLLNVLLGYRDDPLLAPGVVPKLEAALVAFKFWYTEPTPPGRLDNSYYWTENHEAIYHAIEYLMGQQYPDRIFPSDGKSGREHLAHARRLLLRWFDLRARFGFSEWHSNVYYQKDLTPLLTLAEYADDDEIRTRAAMVLDVLLFDMAMHTHRGAFGVTHGRSYKKDKLTSLHDDTWGAVKMLFNQTEYPYQSISHPDAVLLARARRYQVPAAIVRIAQTDAAFADRERMGIDLNEFGPYNANPPAPHEFSFTDPEDLSVWWGIGALTVWQVVPITIQTMEHYNLWETTNFSPFIGLRAFTGDLRFAQDLAIRIAPMLAFGLLKEVNTYTYRTADYMLSSAQDYRKGSFGAQQHAWQATFDANALVFTTHPFRPVLQSTVWSDDQEDGSYWTGEASLPRSAQHENVGIHIYTPQYKARNPEPFDYFRYERYTHAYFPQDHFDEVVQDGQWTFGKFRDGYIALYSYRPTEWISYDPTVVATNGMVKPFDLRANGGPTNVWIVECGRAHDWGSFERFRAAIAASRVEVTEFANGGGGIPNSFDVVYDSPSQGHMTFGWEQPLVINGHDIAITGYQRYDNPWAQTPFNTHRVRIEDAGYGVELDFEHGVRTVFGPQQ